MNAQHLSRDADDGVRGARGRRARRPPRSTSPATGAGRAICRRSRACRAAYGPKRFFFYSLFESDRTGAPLAVRNRAAGSIDAYAAAVGRWLVTRDGFDFLVYYLSDYDFASHAHGPDRRAGGARAQRRGDRRALDAAGGPDEFLERYAVVVCSDHGQTRVDRAARSRRPSPASTGIVVTASNRAGMVYRLPRLPRDAAELARRLDGEPPPRSRFSRGGRGRRAAGRRGARSAADDGWRSTATSRCSTSRTRSARWAALANPNAGEVLVSAAAGWEFADLGGPHHAGGGSHGSLDAGDSEVPMLTVGLEAEPRRITDIAPPCSRTSGRAAGLRAPAHRAA